MLFFDVFSITDTWTSSLQHSLPELGRGLTPWRRYYIGKVVLQNSFPCLGKVEMGRGLTFSNRNGKNIQISKVIYRSFGVHPSGNPLSWIIDVRTTPPRYAGSGRPSSHGCSLICFTDSTPQPHKIRLLDYWRFKSFSTLL